MSGRRRSTGSMMTAFALAVLGVTGSSVAQQPDPQPGGAPFPTPQTTVPGTAQAPMPFNGPGPANPITPPGVPGPDLSGIQVVAMNLSSPAPQRFSFKIDANAPTKELLPTPPAAKPVAGPLLTDDLKAVPEVDFQARAVKPANDGKLTEQAAHQLAKINHMNAKKTDAFMVALLENRPDLAGLPFTMGDDCRTSGERSRQFTIAVNTVRSALGGNRFGPGFGGQGFSGGLFPGGVPQGFNPQGSMGGPPPQQPQPAPVSAPFWTQYPTLCDQEDAARPRPDKELREHVTVARIAALMQMLAPETPELRLGLVKYLTAVPHVEATKALARIAIFSSEDDVRTAAIESLKVRREKDYTDILVKGLRYPFPAVAKRSAEAIAKMGRSDLLAELVAVLSEDDPRMPVVKEKDATVREMVRVNHHRNCMMCHAPRDPVTMPAGALTAEVPIPGQPLPSPSEGYRQSSPDLMIRLDVTYLRQDFSALLPVAEDHPWPEMQRFDFIVRERKLTSEEADAYRKKLTPKEAGVLTPYHKAALTALRELTGKDTAPTADSWRKLLNLPAKNVAKPSELPSE